MGVAAFRWAALGVGAGATLTVAPGRVSRHRLNLVIGSARRKHRNHRIPVMAAHSPPPESGHHQRTQEDAMTKESGVADLGVWTDKDTALVLIDYQNEMFEVIRSETERDLVELNVRLLARTAKAFDVPIVLSTVGVEYGINGPTLPSILADLEGVKPIDRSSMNAFEDQAFRDAVAATGRKRLIVGGLHTEICLTFASVAALQDGYDVMFVTDAVGGRSQTAHRTAIDRLAHAGAVPTTALAVTTELFRDWASPLAGPAREVIYWYFNEVPKLTDEVGVAEAEKRAAAAVQDGH
jgi:nicotinamidase-related amidase